MSHTNSFLFGIILSSIGHSLVPIPIGVVFINISIESRSDVSIFLVEYCAFISKCSFKIDVI